jgi:hypothetical protein
MFFAEYQGRRSPFRPATLAPAHCNGLIGSRLHCAVRPAIPMAACNLQRCACVLCSLLSLQPLGPTALG